MLSLAKVGRGRWAYYLATVAAGREDADGLVEPDGCWLGRGAASLGLERLPVDGMHLGALLEGVDPATGEVLDAAHRRVRVAAYDCTFAAPKSVSLVHALASPPVVVEVRAAHEASVSAVLGYLEDEAARVRRRSDSADRVVPADGLCAAAFLHRASRAPDPHLHSHVLVANLGHDGSGRWSALDGRALFLHAATAGALYRAQLRAELVRRLDVSWRWRDDGLAELAGVRPEALRAFSRRHEAIVAGLAAEGRSGPRSARIVANQTRSEKDLSTSYESLVASWREQAYAVGVSAGRIAALTPSRGERRGATRAAGTMIRQGAAGTMIRQGAAGTMIRQGAAGTMIRQGAPDVRSAPFTRRSLVRARCQALGDGGRVVDVLASVDAELNVGLATGSIVADPDRSLASPQLRGRAGGRIPSGSAEAVLVTSDFLELEHHVSAALRGAPEPDLGPIPPGLWVLRAGSHAAFAAAGRLGEVIRDALADGRPVMAIAPGTRRSAHLEAVTGVPVAACGARIPARRGTLVVLGDADQWDVATLARTLERGAELSATLLALPSPGGGGRRALDAALRAEPARREIGASCLAGPAVAGRPARPGNLVPAADLTAQLARGHRFLAGPVAVRLAPSAAQLVDMLLEEHARQSMELGASVVVVADRSIGRAVEEGCDGKARVVPASELTTALREMPGTGLVVLGGAKLLGRTLERGGAIPRVHVALQPPGANADAVARWGVYVATGRPGIDSGRARGLQGGLARPEGARSPGGPGRAPGLGIGLAGR